MSDSTRTHLSFDERLEQLIEFKKRFGHTNVPKNWSENPRLGRWVVTQRNQFKSGVLDKFRIARLEALDFSFSRLNDPVQDAAIQLDILKRYRTEMQSSLAIPSRNDQNPEYASFAAWLHRLRRKSRGDGVSDEVINLLANENISLSDAASTPNYVGGKKLEEKSFEKNYVNFQTWLNTQEQLGHPRELTYRVSKESEEACRCYKFFEHMLTKARHGILPTEHREKLIELRCLINGKPINEILDPAPSIRSLEGGAISKMNKEVEAAKLRAEIAQSQADRATSDAAAIIAEAQRRAQEAMLRARKAMEEADLLEANVRQRIKDENERASSVPISTKRDNEYITTAELSIRIKYDERTIRERLKDKVLLPGVHYINGFGRKLLFIWNKIEADMLAGKFEDIDV